MSNTFTLILAILSLPCLAEEEQANYAQWKDGWLKRRTDKSVGVSEDEAKKIVAGLRSK
jgi:hypothetical protein